MQLVPRGFYNFWPITFLVCLLCAILSAEAVKQILPVSSPLCVGNGSMFGYSVAMVQSGSWIWLAVGRPWDCAVDIYRTSQVSLPLINSTQVLKVTSCKNDAASSTVPLTATTAADATSCTETTTTTSVFSAPTPTGFSWTPIGSLADPTNTSYTGMNWLGIGASSPMSLFGYDVEFSSTGEWLAVGIPGRSFTKFSDLPVQHISWHPYHGSVILYRKNSVSSYSFFAELSIKDTGTNYSYFDRFGSKVKFSNDSVSPYLFISCNGGWDMVSAPGQATADNKQIIFGVDTVNKIWPANPTKSTAHLGVYAFIFDTTKNKWTYVDFIAAKSQVPLGMLGVDFTVSGNNATDIMVAMRDYRNLAGVVALFNYSSATKKFMETDVIMGANLGSASNWTKENFFGVGLSLISDVLPILHVGAPGSSVFYRLIKQKGRWELDAMTSNPGVQSRSFYAGSMANSHDSRFVLVSNAVTSQGTGVVYIHHRRVPGYSVADYEEEFRSTYSGYIAYDWVATLLKSNATIKGFKQDQFGKDVATMGPWIVVGAPVDGCVYTYVAPLSYALTPGLTPEDIISTIAKGAPNYGLYIGIGVALAFLIIVPLLIYFMIRRHKRKILTQFALNDAMKASQAPPPAPQ